MQVFMNTKRTISVLVAAVALSLGLCAAIQAQASVVMGGTRVIYPAQQSEVTIKLTNAGAAPALTQIWLDKGDPNAEPSAIDVPFAITPPIARIEPGKGQTLRILYTGEPLPQDKESVFWLNMLEVPPKPGEESAATNKLQLAFRTRIKLFFRPEKLKGEAADAPAQVTWRLVQGGRRPAVEARNLTPYHISFSAVELAGGGKSARFEEGEMVGPGETKVLSLNGDVDPGAAIRVKYQSINDYGGTVDGEGALSPSDALAGK